jgi:putative OPT family oligopeptide transporter
MNPPPSGRPSSGGELTIAAIVLGLLLSLVMGAANVYLGLRAGMTVSASIPAAVIAIGILRGILGRRSIREANLVQTSASAGESLAAGVIFTMPALILVNEWERFDFWTTSLVALTGGLLGILFMIPMRRVFVVDNEELKFPEGVACAEVLRAGEEDAGTADEPETRMGIPRDRDADGTKPTLETWSEGSQKSSQETSPRSSSQPESGDGSGVQYVFRGILVGGLFKVAESFLGILRGNVEWATQIGGRVFYFGFEAVPALVAVGYIVGLGIASQVFLGGALGWLVAIPLLGTAGLDAPNAVKLANILWEDQVRYIGVGAMVVGGVASIWHVRRGLVSATAQLIRAIRDRHSSTRVPAEEQDLPGPAIALLGLVCIGLTGGVYYQMLHHHLGVTLLTTGIMIVMSFFFTAVASYIVGLVGNSNSPVSGMTITAVLGTALLISVFGYGGSDGILATLGVAGIVCCVACTSGDVCNDLKTGHLVGASPRLQQLMQVLGVCVAAFVMAPVMTVLHESSDGIGSRDLPAPQAGLFAALTEGFFRDQPLPWDMVGWGVGLGLSLLLIDLLLRRSGSRFQLHVMPVAVGIYLPFGLSVPILIGGWLHHRLSRRASEGELRHGVLATSGIIAGESLVGVLLGILAYYGLRNLWDIPGLGSKVDGAPDDAAPLDGLGGTGVFDGLTVIAMAAVAYWIYRQVRKRSSENDAGVRQSGGDS